jgi:hypothetical protein
MTTNPTSTTTAAATIPPAAGAAVAAGQAMPPRPPLPCLPPDVQLAGGPEATLARIMDVADARDRLAAQLVVAVADIDGLHPELFADLSPQVWLEQVGRMTSQEASTLLATADTLHHLPTVIAGLRDGRLSWSQTRELAAAARTVPVARRAELDALIASLLDDYRGYGPDELTGRIWHTVETWQPDRLTKAQQAAERDEFVALRPTLFGGGSMYGEFGPASFATLAEALDTPLGPPVAADLDDPDAVEQALDELDDQARRLARSHGKRAARRLIDLCQASLAGVKADGTVIPARPTAYVVTTADALCDATQTPGWLLTTLTGGHLRATSTLIQKLIDTRGADLRGIVLDDHGQVIGVGRRTHKPPHWLREAIWVRDLADTAPGSTTAVRRCDIDHIHPFDDGGRTDADNLHPIGRAAHNAKTDNRWTIRRARDGTTRWTHTRTGFHLTRPPTWTGDPDP